ncbi:hypothetical protein PSACC_02212 [Paramicrosporidium saccamoebae]|uniref:AB hydrolase-1 domain-containing protein n=1 Tax=Paramicrosporidium saccamoebae TaxID=1246581 RepID=A0A2H9TJH8_9FUNG|nr:hypothetical protein PSACC_02212 [Paramicrosporidium saccamoebae]
MPIRPERPAGFVGFSGVITVPLFYNNTTNTLDIFARKFLKDGQTVGKIVHLVVGGPGQSSDVWLSHLEGLTTMFGSDTLFVITDHRGMGRSSPLCSPHDISWETNWGGFMAKLKYPIKAITVSNAGRDLVRIAECLREEFPAVEQIVVGSSYGSRVATAAINTSPDIFKVAIMDGLDVENMAGLGPVRIGALLDNCRRNHYCHRVVGEPERLEKLIPAIRAERNGCTRLFFAAMKQHLRIDVECDALELAFYKLLIAKSTPEKRQIPAMLVLALLKQFEECSDEVMVQRMTEKTIRSLKKSGIVTSSGSGTPDDLLVHLYISASEKWHGTPPPYCQVKCDARAYKFCITAAMYQRYRDHFGDSVYLPVGPSQQPLTGNTRVLVLAGALDYSTPLVAAETLVAKMKVPSKQILVFRNRGHGLLHNTECVRRAIKAVLTGGGYDDAQACLNAINSVTLDWEGQDFPNQKKLFAVPPTEDERNSNRAVLENDQSRIRSSWTCTTVILFIIFFFLGLVAGFLYYRRSV